MKQKKLSLLGLGILFGTQRLRPKTPKEVHRFTLPPLAGEASLGRSMDPEAIRFHGAIGEGSGLGNAWKCCNASFSSGELVKENICIDLMRLIVLWTLKVEQAETKHVLILRWGSRSS